MMNEGKFTAKLLKHLRQAMPEAVIFKHADKYTAGIPDFSITLGGITTWWEVKLAPRPLEPIQRETLQRLSRGFWLMWNQEKKQGQIFHVTRYGIFLIHDYRKFWDLFLAVVMTCKTQARN